MLALAMLIGLAADRAVADTVSGTTNGNTAFGTAQPLDEAPDLIIKQVAGNTSAAKRQSISPTYLASDVVGSINANHPAEFYSFYYASGQPIQIGVTPQTSQVTELLLFDQNQDLVAIASGNGADGVSSEIIYPHPAGSTGTWTVEVIGNQPTNYFNYTLHLFAPIVYVTDVLGVYTGGNESGYYAIAVNAGDNLLINASAGNPATQSTELLLYDQNGNLVAIASGNASDGASSVVNFTAPGSGKWTVQVTGNPNYPPHTHFDYDLRIQGATGAGPIAP